MPFEETVIGVAPPAQQPEKSSDQPALEAAQKVFKNKEEMGTYTPEMMAAIRQGAGFPPLEKSQSEGKVNEVRTEIAQAAPRSQEPFVASSEDVKTDYNLSKEDLLKGKKQGFWNKVKSLFG